MPILRRVRVFAAKIETTVGTAIALSGTDGAMNVFDATMTPNIDNETRQGQGGFSHLPAIPGLRQGTCTFKTELSGDGAGGVPLWASTFLPACGWVNSTGTFSPKSEFPGSNVKTLTIGLYENGLYKQLVGAMGTFQVTFPAGQLPMIEWTFTGIYSTPTDVAIIAPTYPTTLPFRFYAETLTLGSFSPILQQVTLDAGNQVIARPDAGPVSGIRSALITDRLVTGTMNPEAVLVASTDHVTKWLASTEEALTIELDNGTDRITFAAPKCQRTNVSEGDRDGNQTDEIEFQCNRSASAGNDELTIAFAATD